MGSFLRRKNRLIEKALEGEEFVKDFNDPRLLKAEKDLEPQAKKMVDWLNKNSRSELRHWKYHVSRMDTIDFPETMCAFARFETMDSSRQFWELLVIAPVGLDEVSVKQKTPGVGSREERIGFGLKKKDLDDPAKLFSGARVFPAKPLRKGRMSAWEYQ